jgi:hypothetical protein
MLWMSNVTELTSSKVPTVYSTSVPVSVCELCLAASVSSHGQHNPYVMLICSLGLRACIGLRGDGLQ